MLGPFFIGGFFNGTWRRLVVSWGLVVFVGLLGVFTAHCPYPWRQSIDAGVFVGLAWGVAATLYYTSAERPQGESGVGSCDLQRHAVTVQRCGPFPGSALGASDWRYLAAIDKLPEIDVDQCFSHQIACAI